METRFWRQIALIGATASGKSSLAFKLAKRYDGLILSLDSLSVYRHIDIASAKPPKEELVAIPHYGIDIQEPDEPFDATRFIRLYQEASLNALEQKKPLFIVGGSGFYLKMLLEGISPLPEISPEIRRKTKTLLTDLPDAHRYLQSEAPRFADTIAASDRYRIEKGLLILLQTGKDPLDYFSDNPPRSPVREALPLFEIEWPKELLRERIVQRTDAMLHQGLLDEVSMLEHRYGRAPHAMKAIGISEVLDYFDGRIDFNRMREKIITDTARLAKRQQTFNRSQFSEVTRGTKEFIEEAVEKYLHRNL